MIDSNLLQQLKEIFKKLTRPVELVLLSSSHAKQQELEEMLKEVASTSEFILVSKDETLSDVPSFYIKHSQIPTGVSFRGIPGGHEFSSLILAILNSDGKGKMPDDGIIHRIKKLPPLSLKTYISLSCENCPEVVQALNLISILNSNVTHEMVNGELVVEEVESLNIQGVPSVFTNNNMILSGKSSLGEILSTLEKINPSSEKDTEENLNLGSFDVAIIGGGPAGVSAAIYTARKGLSVVMVSGNIGGQVKETKGIENLISVSYTEGPQLSAQLDKHLSDYPVKVFNNRQVKNLSSEENGFTISLTSQEEIRAKKIIIATGAKWRELNIPGEKEFLGKGVAFCPHCDGPFYKGKDIAVIGGGNSGVEAAIDLSGIVNSVTLIEYNPLLKADKVLVDKLMNISNVKVLTGSKTLEIKGNEGKVSSLIIERESKTEELPLDGVFVQIGLVPNSQFAKEIVQLNKFGEIEVDHKGRTSQEGIYAAGDVTNTPFKQIIISMGEGAKAALTCFEELVLKS